MPRRKIMYNVINKSMSNVEIYDTYKDLVSNSVGWNMFVKNLQAHGKHYISKTDLIGMFAGTYKKREVDIIKLTREEKLSNIEKLLDIHFNNPMCRPWIV